MFNFLYKNKFLNSILFPMIQALHEALMRQDDLLAYIDREEDEKYHKVNH